MELQRRAEVQPACRHGGADGRQRSSSRARIADSVVRVGGPRLFKGAQGQLQPTSHHHCDAWGPFELDTARKLTYIG
jgi:hypothetical protein